MPAVFTHDTQNKEKKNTQKTKHPTEFWHLWKIQTSPRKWKQMEPPENIIPLMSEWEFIQSKPEKQNNKQKHPDRTIQDTHKLVEFYHNITMAISAHRKLTTVKICWQNYTAAHNKQWNTKKQC